MSVSIQKPPFGRFVAFVNEVDDKSDRAATLVAGSACERALRKMLQARGVGVAGGFKDFIDRSCQRGLIDRETATGLHLLREIRNEAAHSDDPFDLAAWEPKVREMVMTIDPTRAATTVDPKIEFRRFAVLAGGVLRLSAALPSGRASLRPVSLRRIATALTPPIALVLVLGGLLLFALYLSARQPLPDARVKLTGLRQP